jgi:uncharacterized RDD family membrane protein YckC
VAPPAPAPVASLARRVVAFLLDGFVLVPVYLAYAILLDALFGTLVVPAPDGSGLVVVAVSPLRVVVELTLTLLTDAAYFAGCWVRWGTTAGQRVCGIAVGGIPPGPSSGAGGAGRVAPPPRDPGPPARDPGPPVLVPGGLERVALQAATVRWAVLQLLPLCVGTLGGAGAASLQAVVVLNTTWFGLLFATAAVDPLRRGLHDRAAGTVVVRRT